MADISNGTYEDGETTMIKLIPGIIKHIELTVNNSTEPISAETVQKAIFEKIQSTEVLIGGEYLRDSTTVTYKNALDKMCILIYSSYNRWSKDADYVKNVEYHKDFSDCIDKIVEYKNSHLEMPLASSSEWPRITKQLENVIGVFKFNAIEQAEYYEEMSDGLKSLLPHKVEQTTQAAHSIIDQLSENIGKIANTTSQAFMANKMAFIAGYLIWSMIIIFAAKYLIHKSEEKITRTRKRD